MLNKIIQWSLDKRLLVLVAAVALLIYGGIVILANIITDVARGIIDPKVSYE